jgi:acyl carrier protein
VEARVLRRSRDELDGFDWTPDRRSRIRNFIADELFLNDEDLNESTDLLAILDSQALMQLVVFIEEDLKIPIGEQEIAPENNEESQAHNPDDQAPSCKPPVGCTVNASPPPDSR